MGVVAYSLMSDPRSKSALELLGWCHELGAGGVQVGLDSLAEDDTAKLRERSAALNMYLEVITDLPKVNDTGTFEQVVAAAKRAGAVAIRTACLSGRRYETFSTLEEWNRFVEDARARIRLAAPIVDKHKIPLGIENHKDWTADDVSKLLKEYSSEYVGACLDFGNNISLLDDAQELVEAIAPYAVTTHVKDMAVEEYEEGFLLSEVPLGEGKLDLARIVETVRKARPQAKFSLEMITRDPLKIPCLTEKYWVAFPERNGKFLARTLAWVRAHHSAQPLPRVAGLEPAARLKLEEENVRKSLDFARAKLGLVSA
jgi:sugar phosphate isomerase/epimerase